MTGSGRVVLSGGQQRAIVALLTSRTQADAARAAGISERTLRRWLADPTFRTAYRAAGREAAADALTRLLAVQGQAVDALVDALTETTPAVRVRAARGLLEIGARAVDHDIDERLTALERERDRWIRDG